MGKKKKFIDKKKAATFQLFARDSSDPNYNDSPGSDRVFIRVDNSAYSVNSFFDDESRDSVSGTTQYHNDSNSIFADAPEDNDDADDGDRVFGSLVLFQGEICEIGGSVSRKVPLPEHVKREILELGFPDDGYNYLIHLREIKNTGGGSAFYHNPKAKLDQLPHDVKAYDASRVQISQEKGVPSEKSIYSVASRTVSVRVQKAVDPDVAALLDDSDLSRFGSDVEDMEEDFVIQANLSKEVDDLDIDKKLNLVEKPEANNNLFEEPEASNKGIDESLTYGHHENAVDLDALDEVRDQPVISGNDCAGEKPRAHRLLDEQFDLLERQEYGTDSDDGYDGHIGEEEESFANKLQNVLNDRQVDDLELDDKYVVPADLLHKNDGPKSKELLDSAADVIRRCVEYAEKYENGNEDDEMVVVQESTDESEEWDCDTIVSTYSNLDNHPGKINAPERARKKKLAGTVSEALSSNSHVISLRGKEKLPVDFLPHRKAAAEKVKGLGGLKTEQPKRKQHGQESKEEKKERKAAVKEERRDARRMKKEIKGLYLCEAQRAQRVAAISGPSSIHLM